MNTEPATLPEDCREVLDYLINATATDPNAYCWAVGKGDLYHFEYGSYEPVRSQGNFLYTTLKAMERRGLVTRHPMREGMVRGPSSKYTVARITDAGREAWKRAQ